MTTFAFGWFRKRKFEKHNEQIGSAAYERGVRQRVGNTMIRLLNTYRPDEKWEQKEFSVVRMTDPNDIAKTPLTYGTPVLQMGAIITIPLSTYAADKAIADVLGDNWRKRK
jgi:hypothetical protein